MTTTEHPTYCRICEPTCGMVATVEDGRLVTLRPDVEHPITKGFSCPKGIEFIDVQNDPDRLLYPMRRTPSGDFERISWSTALAEIGQRLRAIRATHGGSAIGWYAGNPSAFSHSHALWSAGFVRGLGSPHMYTPNTQDTSSRFVAAALIYGSATIFPLPDLARTDFLLMLGANPLVSRGSIVAAGNMREKLRGIVARGGRVVVVDPRRTETAKAFEHVAVRPDSDAWLLLALLHVMFAEKLVDEAALAAQASGADVLRTVAAGCSPEDAAIRCGVPASEIRTLARAFARAPAAAAYGRTGACLGRHATLVNVLLDALNVVTGNLDRPGGAVFARPPIDFTALALRLGVATYDTYRSRVGDLPEVLGQLPAPLMAPEIQTPGPGQLRALIVSAGNPVLSVPGSRQLERALDKLDLQVGIDLYLNETHRHADYVLPAATFYERDDVPIPLLEIQLTPFVQWTDAVATPRGEARPDWQIVDDLARELGFAPMAGVLAKRLGPARAARATQRIIRPVARRVTPSRLVDLLLRSGRDGDRFGLRRGGLSLAKLRANPRGVVLAAQIETGVLGKRVQHRDRRVHLGGPQIAAELRRLLVEPAPAEFPLLMIGRREVRSHNSWMHNTPRLRDGTRRHRALVNPADARAAGVAEGERVRIVSAHGSIELPAELTDDVGPGTVAVPHGWGHRDGGWTVANAAGGANVNELTSADPHDLERVSGMAHLNGVAVRLEAMPAAARAEVAGSAAGV
ncbi:MAG TPA: molybdopterin-dependent oxidoreductase [Jatrophihabitans sp.]|jgi:formate dehydrogenase|nr:molybdopterin-dependent oxidoreductase [Jatrophihabitans sp.]